eukprot:5483927-Prymnesium_polylepis.1
MAGARIRRRFSRRAPAVLRRQALGQGAPTRMLHRRDSLVVRLGRAGAQLAAGAIIGSGSCHNRVVLALNSLQ